MRLGLYGGSFDPVHCGHLLVTQAAIEEQALDLVLFIPASQSPFKTDASPTPAPLRLRMLRLALAGQTRCQVDSLEIDRGGVSYTVDTVDRLRRRHPTAEIFWLIGADHVPTLPLWRDAEQLAAQVEFLVIPRPGAIEVPLSPHYRLRWLRGWPLGISSSEIRERAAAGKTLRGLVPDSVAETILAEKLYCSAPRNGSNVPSAFIPSQHQHHSPLIPLNHA